MVPMAEVTVLSADQSTAAAIELACGRGHFRLPVVQGEAATVIGIIALDLWKLMDPALETRPIESLLGAVEFVQVQQPVHELLPLLSAREDRMAMVRDDSGSTVGMLTLEDIHEAVVGDVVGVGFNIPGYVHRSALLFEPQGEDAFVIDARTPVALVNERLGARLPIAEGDTIGGLFMARLRHAPKTGESILIGDYQLAIEEVTGKVIRQIRISSVRSASPS